MGVNASIEGSNPSFSVERAPLGPFVRVREVDAAMSSFVYGGLQTEQA